MIYDDISCPQRSTVAMIAVICLIGCLAETMMSNIDERPLSLMNSLVETARFLIVALFLMANLLLLLATIVENGILVQIYLWSTLGFIVMGFVVTIAGFLENIQSQGLVSFLILVPEVIFLFVVTRCLPLVDMYRKSLDYYSNY